MIVAGCHLLSKLEDLVLRDSATGDCVCVHDHRSRPYHSELHLTHVHTSAHTVM